MRHGAHPLPAWVAVVVGLVVLGIGALGASGRMATSPVRLYRGRRSADPERHARGQRLGGALLVAGGLVFVVVGLLTL